MASLLEEFENSEFVRNIKREKLSVENLAKHFWECMSDRSNELLHDIPIDARPRSGFVICGYPGSDFFPEEHSTVVPTEPPKRLRPPANGQPDFGANWYGASDAIVRLHHGRDDRIFDLLRSEDVDADQVDRLKTKVSHELQYQVLFHAMPLGDAIDYAEFLLQTTISRFRFVMGAEVCGGAIDIATITRKDGLSWVRRKGRISSGENR